MRFRLGCHRLLLLGLASLSGCAMSGVAAATPPASGGLSAYLAGSFAVQTGHMERGASLLLAAHDANPANADLAQEAFLALLMAGRPEAATLAESLRGQSFADLLLGDQAAKAGDWAGAKRDFAAIRVSGLVEYLVPLLTAWADAGAGDADGAVATLQPLLTDTNPLGPSYQLHLGLIADLSDRFPDARRDYDAARQGFSGTNLRFTRILANWEYRQGHRDQAESTVRALSDSAPGLDLLVPGLLHTLPERPVRTAADGLAEAYLSFAAQLVAEAASDQKPATSQAEARDSAREAANDTDLAASLLRLALDLRPGFSAARLLLSYSLPPDTSPDTIRAVLAPVPADDALAPLVALRLANLDSNAGEFAAAEARLRRLAASLPGRPEPLAALGDTELRRGDDAAAAAAYGQAIALAPSAASSWRLYFARANAEQLGGNWRAAEADLKQALALSPDQPTVLNFLGFAWADRGEHLPDAQAMLTRAVALDPNDGAIIDSLGWVDLRRGQVAQAVHYLEQAVHLEPADPEINFHLGDAYWAAGDKLQARYQWQLALALKPDKAMIPRLEAKLQTARAATEAHP